MRTLRLLSLLLVVTSIVGCSKPFTTVPRDSGTDTPTRTAPQAGDEVPAEDSRTSEQKAMQALKQAGMVVYFAFDDADIRPEYLDLVAAHARYLGENPSRRVRLEGHADERGSREYNIGLGERRAQALRRALMLQGARDNQLVTVSYGEERPAESGSDEAAWAKNRRVELHYAF